MTFTPRVYSVQFYPFSKEAGKASEFKKKIKKKINENDVAFGKITLT